MRGTTGTPPDHDRSHCRPCHRSVSADGWPAVLPSGAVLPTLALEDAARDPGLADPGGRDERGGDRLVHRVDPGHRAQLDEDVAQVPLDGRLGEVELRGDL